MLKMSQVTSIREQWSEGKTISEIARAVSVDRNTVYKYTQMTDFSKAVALYVPRGCMLDKHRDEIIAMLKEERKWFHKQCWRPLILTKKCSPKSTNLEFTDFNRCRKAADESFFNDSGIIRIACSSAELERKQRSDLQPFCSCLCRTPL